MKTEKTDNELIAEFMGVKEQQGFYDSYNRDEPYWFTANEVLRTDSRSLPDLSFDDFIECSKYDRSWEWIMPVVAKITPIAKEMGQQAWFDAQYALIDADIKGVNKRALNFIKWYNQQKST